MGMFDNVNAPDTKCPVCDTMLSDWQSKDGDCLLDTINYTTVDHFYTSCNNCDAWIEFDRQENEHGIVRYDITCKPNGKYSK